MELLKTKSQLMAQGQPLVMPPEVYENGSWIVGPADMRRQLADVGASVWAAQRARANPDHRFETERLPDQSLWAGRAAPIGVAARG